MQQWIEIHIFKGQIGGGGEEAHRLHTADLFLLGLKLHHYASLSSNRPILQFLMHALKWWKHFDRTH
jgi:hypothetical protein